MKRLLPVLLVALMIFSPVSLGEIASPEDSPVPADPTKGSQLVGLFITKEDIAPFIGEEGFLWASVSGESTDSEPEYRFEVVDGLRLICFTVVEDSNEGNSIVSNVDEGISAVDFNLSEDNSTITMKASVSVVPRQDEEMFSTTLFYEQEMAGILLFRETIW